MSEHPGDEPTSPQPQPTAPQPGYWEQQQAQQAPWQQPHAPAPYGYPQPGQPYAYAPDHPRATTALVLGVLGLVVCGVLAPFAWHVGKQTMEEIDRSQGQLGGRGAAQAGYVLGIIGSVILALGLLVLVGYAVVVVAILGAGFAGS